MKRRLDRFGNNKFRIFIRKHKKYAPLIFFIGGFIFDSFTLGRIDRLYDLIILCLHMSALTITLYLYNVAYDGKWQNTILHRYEEYFPLAIQFFFGGLSSAYVIYFSRSVSLSSTMSFFVILVILLIANEFLKKRISNKYLQFSVYFFLNLTFFTFMIPVFIKEMNTNVFIFSSLVSLILTLVVIIIIYAASPNTRKEIHKGKIIGLILSIYALINSFYFLKLIPPVPLALHRGIAAHEVTLVNNDYLVSYERADSKMFWRDHKLKFIYNPGDKVFAFASIFAPTDIKKSIFHRWKWYNEETKEWEITDNIGYRITGGRDTGYRGYTFKTNVKPGEWKVQVITSEELVIGVIDFEIIIDPTLKPNKIIQEKL
ncbi:DUF2914 domain-containing protein [Algibacter mikhailovii]|uniref:DUF2914 domain-containing protein n=1 Tax=Algibacter mikhailovii TaxID=425498 RepID=A0A918VE13_9FLAO|nr:DUF2914 domain-containing protein [Algibacter mikhailovii]GGZ93987.1 hypothetical protein GCM10007028_35470 [Algibacter mikhailovii]